MAREKKRDESACAPSSAADDLIVLSADKDAQMALTSLLARHQALGIRKLNFKVEAHRKKDTGCASENAIEFLRLYCASYQKAILIFDYEGCGLDTRARKRKSVVDIEASFEAKLARNGWHGDRAKVIIFEPELEAWLWNASANLAKFLNCPNFAHLKKNLEDADFVFSDREKPARPKEAFELALERARKARSSSLFKKLGEDLDFRGCTERSFVKFQQTLQSWFAQPSQHRMK